MKRCSIKTEDDLIRENIELTCERNDVPELLPHIKYRFLFEIPDSFSRVHLASRLIEFSRKLWDAATKKHRKNAVVHEVAHIVVDYKYGNVLNKHGHEWINCVERTGEKTHVFYGGDDNEVYVVGCSCKQRTVTQEDFEDIKYNLYKCAKCGSPVLTLSGQ